MKKVNYQRGIGPLVIIIVLAIAAIIGGGVYYSAKKSKMESQKPEEQAQVNGNAEVNANANASVNTAGTIRGIFALGKNMMCTFDGTSATGSTSGTMYISKDNARGDFVTTETGKAQVNSSMIRQNSTIYVWSGSQGAKMNFADMNKASTSSKVDLDQKVNYKCSDWTPDASKFVVPTNVKFVDIEAMIKGTIKLGK